MNSPSLTDADLAVLIARFGDGAEALALTGSHARATATLYSDIDLLRFVTDEGLAEREPFQFRLVGGRMVSVTTTTFAAKRAELTRPEHALWAVEGLRQARPLRDRSGELAALLAEAHAFTWTPELCDATRDHVATTLAELGEEVHKLLGGLSRGDTSAALYAALGLQQSLIRAALVYHCALLRSENDFFATALALWSDQPRWRSLLCVMVGLDAPDGPDLASGRAAAALELYDEASRLMADALAGTGERREIVNLTLKRIAEFWRLLPGA